MRRMVVPISGSWNGNLDPFPFGIQRAGDERRPVRRNGMPTGQRLRPHFSGSYGVFCNRCGSVKRPLSLALPSQESTKLKSGKVRCCGGDVRAFELSRKSLTRTLGELFVDVTDHFPVVAEELGRTMHDVAEKHGSFCSGRNHNDGTARRMAGCAAHINARQDRAILAPRLEPIRNRGKQLRGLSPTHQRDGQAVIEGVGTHKEIPVGLVASVCCFVEESAFSIGGPSQMVEMEMGQYDVGDLRGLDTKGGQVSHEHPGSFRISMRTDACVHENNMFATAHEETAHFDGQHSVRVEEPGMLEPILVGLIEQGRWWHRKAAVRNAFDCHGPYLHGATIVPRASRTRGLKPLQLSAVGR
jgi:hypothetical protein